MKCYADLTFVLLLLHLFYAFSVSIFLNIWELDLPLSLIDRRVDRSFPVFPDVSKSNSTVQAFFQRKLLHLCNRKK